MHTVAILALEDVILFDLGTPVEVFRTARLLDGRAAYRVLVAGPEPEVGAGVVSLRVPHGLEALETADTIIVPGLADPLRPVPQAVVAALRQAHDAGTRVASICVGTFTLAATGLLDGRRATTHWRAADLLAARHPAIDVDPAVLFVDEGSLLTSAGASAGIDLCLHLVRRDHGAAVAADAARSAVLPLTRPGGQAQFILRDALGPDATPLSATLAWVEEHAHRPLTLQDIADRAGVSTRTLNRRFREQTNMTPLAWLGAARIRLAQSLLETTDHSVERIAHQTGFGSAANFRAKFRAALDTSPAAYRLAFATVSRG
ncbi:GlxA family transcriptional regulator [Nocardioides sp. cx-173]|uniref:GlxA family transcriptional regulator n=1 Tax=Nocardioides sp. cx-173 TaxID=2898796 RepID=UPI001E5E53F5|nr:helix-turn-helix domain-containing protein [Nocardioides sp. cx-173]MCD4523892.1 helix-turn-helix domain-containing protein [Nocardioides sp. cx-173]UGB41789.1 helix-turn-helix domain-containing protein [Nocardioides sp. cx-173]